MSKDVLIAGGVVVVCIILVVVALTATGKKKPADDFSSTDSAYTYTPPPVDSSYSPPPIDSGFGPAPGASDPGAAGTPGSLDGFNSPYQPSTLPPIGSTQGDLPGTDFGATPSVATGIEPSPFGATSTTSPMSAVEPVSAAPTVQGGGTHVVAKGETLGDISATHYGTTKHWKKIVEANPGLDPARLKIGQTLAIPAVESAAPAAAAAAGGADTYTVKSGESYYTIAKKVLGSASKWRELEKLNGIPAESLKVGTVLKVPAKDAGGSAAVGGAAGGRTHIVGKGETLGDISKQHFGTTTKWKLIVEANPGLRPEALKIGQQITIPDAPASTGGTADTASAGGYTVKSGDTLESIAASQLGKKSAWKQIVEANPGLKPTALRVGQKIVIPGAAAAPAAGGLLDVGAPSMGGEAIPGSAAPSAPAAPARPDYLDDPFYSPYDTLPASPAATTP